MLTCKAQGLSLSGKVCVTKQPNSKILLKIVAAKFNI